MFILKKLTHLQDDKLESVDRDEVQKIVDESFEKMCNYANMQRYVEAVLEWLDEE